MNKTMTTEHNRVVEAYALIDLAEANVSSVTDAAAWDQEVAFLQRGRPDSSSDGGVDDTLALTTLLA